MILFSARVKRVVENAILPTIGFFFVPSSAARYAFDNNEYVWSRSRYFIVVTP